ncbi:MULTISPECIES: bifunctional glycosyltransferase/CDP-glycerol:glycerophosphate glycerophosphotransferase [Streptomyces]|uniref:Bifunctional glycosyltransferase family 2 protein/CDP-glycerol:glycerophosphate glycerophosphotransferase n=1 Tax=Streptomyces doudnae TaxID=3075536 RepID=A0ABD5EMA5_9ACTN|nr:MULTISPECIES: bifunctional glycosyltransferase family 2 protein/CDP-glycerol:glycerophosphate glycerophosphotransferase [unclassified Streptomyces]MDT0435776.1 bifunctional glycosyltransferase family 2 protein/CDP-glycerol:glycerophosphate glycerophosphotransferase [Streptomyces sp. DSM 41981]MYQ64905.1 glycosyltransferase [Streptomyces sp. SID4950]SCD88596.1 CDP-glycerol:poly(glycerophosphate) glycerophosphotransferase [Streptomyces sp. SolWspMP-5a-2]
MPRFSVIVPAYKVQAYLPACLESVLSQSYQDLEVIAVDDCSPDGVGAVIEEFAARDPRVRALRLPENQGLGRARNAGMELACGDYLLFLDGDDTLAPHALRAVADRLKETDEPDVLVFDYARLYWTGETVRNKAAAQLAEAGPAPFRLTDRPGLLRLLMVAWNKAYRREFVLREGFVFPPGLYEDTPWTYPVLMTAGSVATLDRVCVHYRQRRAGNILGTVDRAHFDVFDQYDRVFAFVAARPELDGWRPVLFQRMVDHLLTVYTRGDRLPRDARAAFLRKARTHYRRYRVPGAPLPLYARLRHTLVRRGLHRTFRVLRWAAALRRRLRGIGAASLRALRGAALRLHYRVQRALPLRADRALFTADGGHGHGCQPGALEEAVRTHAPHVRTTWAARPEHHHTLPPATARVVPGSAAYFTALARSAYLVGNGHFDARLVKRRGQVLVQTRRGTPLTHTGLDLQERPAAARGTDFGALLADVDRWDYLVSGNRHSTLVWERVHPGRYTTLEFGSPRNDVFQRATPADVARLRASLGVPEDAVAILYAPARRDYRRTQCSPLDLERVALRLGPRFTLLARLPGRDGGPADPAGPRVIDVSGHPRVAELCLASDALVTDYASLMVDYAALDRPIVLHTADEEAFEAARGTYVDLRSCPPGAVARSEDELIDVFATGDWNGSRSARSRAAFRERFCPFDDGRAAERVVRRVVLGETAPVPVLPLAERRPVPSAAAGRARAPQATVPAPTGALAVPDSH